METLKEIVEKWSQKLTAISILSVMMSSSTGGLCPKDVNERMPDVKQIITDKMKKVP